MPTLKIRNIQDARAIVDRYKLSTRPDLSAEGLFGWSWPDFAAWLFFRTNSVAANDLADYIEEFETVYEARGASDPTFSEIGKGPAIPF